MMNFWRRETAEALVEGSFKCELVGKAMGPLVGDGVCTHYERRCIVHATNIK